MSIPRPVVSVLVFVLMFAVPVGLIVNASGTGGQKQGASAALPSASTPKASGDPTPTPAIRESKLYIGSPDAPVTLIEYGDFQCPFCAQFFRQTEPQILADYVDTGKVRIEFRVETHIGEESVRAGEAAYCANDQNAFKQFHDELYRRQSGYNSGTFSDANLKKIASDIQLDKTVFASCLDTQKYQSAVTASHAEAGERGVTQTPTVYIGDHKVAGAQPYQIYKALLDKELDE